MDQHAVFLTLLGMGVVTYLPRVLPLWLLANRSLPPLMVAWLRYVPVAVLAALLSPILFMPNGAPDFSLNNLFLWAALPTFFVAYKSKNLFLTVIAGMVVVAVARWVSGW